MRTFPASYVFTRTPRRVRKYQRDKRLKQQLLQENRWFNETRGGSVARFEKVSNEGRGGLKKGGRCIIYNDKAKLRIPFVR